MKKIYIDSNKLLIESSSYISRYRELMKKIFIYSYPKFSKKKNSVQFLYSHHVFYDEKKSFIKQINYLKNIGDFISYDDALKINRYKKKINGRYFVLSFDDGFKNNLEICDILLSYKIPATFFIPVSFIGNKREDSGEVFFFNKNLYINFLDWKDCKKIKNDRLFNIESHSVNHKNFLHLNKQQILFELNQSKLEIKRRLNLSVKHFACPYGGYNKFYDLETARKVGYKSFSISERGELFQKTKNFLIKRHNLDSSWPIKFLKFFLN